MELIHIFLIFSVDFLSVMLATGKPDPLKDVRINAIGKNANISWNISLNEWKTTIISLYDSKGDKVTFDSSNAYKYVPFPNTSYEIVNLTLCAEYVVNILYKNTAGQWSDFTKRKFWMTNTTVTAEIEENVELSWRTGFTDNSAISVYAPTKLIYAVQFGTLIHNSDKKKYKLGEKSKDVSTINITIIRVETTDAGLYRSRDDLNVNRCCLLVVTTKPTDPTLTISPEHPFVNSRVIFTCHSTVQRWPGYIPSNLSYQFFGNRRGDDENNKLIINTLAKSDKGMNISCQATDDRKKVSIMSDAVTLDPYYGPDNVVLKPGHTTINVTEGTTLGPIRCTATCNPKCLFRWKLNQSRTFEDVLSGETLNVENIKKNKAGIYRCLVVYPYNTTLRRRTDISVNVHFSPKIRTLWLSDKNYTYGSRSPTIYSFSEGNHLTITLRIESNPDPQIVIHSSLLKFPTLLYTKQSNDFSTKLPSLRCENTGNFTIHASNGIAYGDNRTVNLVIRCKPRDVKTERKIGTKVNTDVRIVMNVISFPAPTVTWLRKTAFIWRVEKDKYDYRHNISSTIRITSIDDFSEHGIKICNTLGCIVENITLKPEDKPEAPRNFSVETTTFRSVNLSWIVGFNGGHEQTFSVQFKTRDGGQEVTKTVQTDDITTGSTVYFTLNELKADTSYQVMVLSTNKHGKRNASLEFKTKVEPTVKSPSKSASMPGILVGIGCGIAVILIIVTSLYVFCSRRNRGTKSENENEDSNEPANAEYASVAKSKSKSKKVHYKEDEIETANDEYAVVDKSNKKIDYTENDNVYSNQGDADLLIHQPLKAKPSGRSKNQDGLTYIEVSFTRKPKDRRRIIGAENRTDYVDIDFTRKADPLPDSSDE
ncbi:nephrin-like [Mytilus californianus]|uniref:nephrin-like n=1 Tax=Mytilus californianus TaxID=6549 RepID=UPI002247CF3F|nr:nephrin-like [Mytilus californianus]